MLDEFIRALWAVFLTLLLVFSLYLLISCGEEDHRNIECATYGCEPDSARPSPTPVKGEKGEPGDQGPIGPKGSPGPKGDTGTAAPNPNIYPLQLCPDIPGPYPEVLMCFNGRLFAVYGDPKRISYVEVTPGKYLTTDGRPCYFIVKSKCEVTYD